MIKQLNTDWVSMEDPMNKKYSSLVCSDLEVKLEGSDKVKTWRWKKDNAETWSPK